MRQGISQFLAVAAVAICAACAGTPAGTPLQSGATATAPAISVGDSWTYRVHDAYTGLERGNRNYRVTDAGNGRIEVVVSGAGGGPDETRVFDREWGWLKHPATHLQSFEYRPAYPAFAFPLAPGKTWRAKLAATDPANGLRFPVTVSGTVVGWERVRVPAGEFDAVKIKRVVFFDYLDAVRGRSEIVEHEWYAPAVKQSVRREATAKYLSFLYGDSGTAGFRRIASSGGKNDSGPRYVRDEWLISELVSYSVR